MKELDRFVMWNSTYSKSHPIKCTYILLKDIYENFMTDEKRRTYHIKIIVEDARMHLGAVRYLFFDGIAVADKGARKHFETFRKLKEEEVNEFPLTGILGFLYLGKLMNPFGEIMVTPKIEFGALRYIGDG